MQRLLLATTAVLLTPLLLHSPAQAQSGLHLRCGPPTMSVGTDTSNNPVTAVIITRVAGAGWVVTHHFRDGGMVARNDQYAMTDMTNADRTQWAGLLHRNRNLLMVGNVWRQNASIKYVERLYDRSKNNALVMEAWTQCALREPQQAQPQQPTQPYQQPQQPQQTQPYQQAYPPPGRFAPPPGQRDSVPIYTDGRRIEVDVIIGGLPLRMLLDTGASICLITPAIANRIVATGQGAWQEPISVTDAHGNKTMVKLLLINELRIGQHVVRNVAAGISATADDMLLSFPVVNSIAPFTIDTRTKELVWHYSEGRS